MKGILYKNLGNSWFFSRRDPEIGGFTRGVDWTGGRRRKSVHILTFTVDCVCNLGQKKKKITAKPLFPITILIDAITCHFVFGEALTKTKVRVHNQIQSGFKYILCTISSHKQKYCHCRDHPLKTVSLCLIQITLIKTCVTSQLHLH